MKKVMLALVAALVLATAPRAEAITVLLDTTPLQSLGGEWYLDFQVADGDGAINNVVTLTGIDLGIGGAFLSVVLTGDAAGSVPSFTLGDSPGFNQVLVRFTAGDEVRFDLSYTNNFAGGFFPDTFSWAVLDGSRPPPNSIVDGGLGAGLVILLDGTTNIELNPADSAYDFITPQIVSVPEPVAATMFFSGLAVAIARRRRRA
jgi:hypothetical protein